MTQDTEIVLVSQLIDTEPLIDGRVRQTYRVLNHEGLLVRWIGRIDGERYEGQQFYETADGRRFASGDEALKAWQALQPPQIVERFAIPAPAPRESAQDAEIRMRRIIDRSAIPARLRALDDAHIPYEEVRPGQYRVLGDIEYYPAIGTWRALSSGAYGYTVRSLIAAAQRISLETANETRGGAGEDCSVGKRGEWPPQGGESNSRSRTPGMSLSVTSGGGEQPRPCSHPLLPVISL